MFEFTAEELTAVVMINGRDYGLAYQHGLPVEDGQNRLTYAEALDLVRKFDRVIAGGVNYKRNERSLKQTRNQIVTAFGPAMSDLVGFIPV